MASVIAKISPVLHRSFMEKWKSASRDSPKKFTDKETGPSKEDQRGEKGTLLLCHCCFLKDSTKFPASYLWHGLLSLYFKISFKGPVLIKVYPKLI